MLKPDDRVNVTRRAFAALYRSNIREGCIHQQPTRNDDATVEHGGKTYVVLTMGDGYVVVVYRVRTDGRLKRLRRWPRVVEE